MSEYADKLLGAMNAEGSIDDEDSQSARGAGVSVDKWAFLGKATGNLFKTVFVIYRNPSCAT